MGLITSIVAAEEDEIESVGESLSPRDEWSGLERRGLDITKIAMLHCLVTGDIFEQAIIYYEPVYVAERAWVLRVANEVLESLAEFDEEALELLSEELAATEAFEQEPWDSDSVRELVMELSELARLAESQGQILLVWMHPLLT